MPAAFTPRLVPPTLAALWTFLALSLPVLAALVAPISVVDLAYGVRAGELMLETGEILRVDPFTFTAGGDPWLDQQWGAQIAFAVVHGLGGWEALAFLRALLVALLGGAILATWRLASLGPRTAALLAIGLFLLAAPGFALRPQLVGLVLLATAGLLVVGRHERPRALAFVPLLALVAANSHGTFVVLPFVALAAAVDDALGGRHTAAVRVAIAGAISLGATLVTPWGVEAWGYAAEVASSPAVRELAAEWQPPDPLGVPGLPFLAAVGLVAVLGVRAGRVAVTRAGPRGAMRDLPWGSLALVAALALLGATAARAIPVWAVVAPVAVVPLIRVVDGSARGRGEAGPLRSPGRGLEGRRWANGAIVAALLVGAIAAVPVWRSLDRGLLPILADAPVALATALRTTTEPGDRLVVPQRLASWLALEVPGRPLMVDSRFELFDAAVWSDYLAIVAGGDGALAALERWEVGVVVLDDSMSGLASTLANDPRYRVVGAGPGWSIVRVSR